MITITGPNSFIEKNFINFLNKKILKTLFYQEKNQNPKNKSNYYNFTKEQKKQTDTLIHISSSALAFI